MRVLLENTTFLLNKIVRIAGIIKLASIIRLAGIIRGGDLLQTLKFWNMIVCTLCTERRNLL